MSILEVVDPVFLRDVLKSVSDSTGVQGSSPPPRLVVVGGSDGSLIRIVKVSSDGSLVIDSATLSTMIRWGRNVSPFWVHGSEVTAPSAGTALVSRTVTSGKVGYIYGFFIMAGEANDFRINWTSGGIARSIRIPFGGRGAVHYADFVPLNEGMPADGGTSITITNVNAGSSGVAYQARLLIGEI